MRDFLNTETVPVMQEKILSVAAVLLLSVAMGAAQADEMKVGGTGATHGVLLRLSEAFGAAHPGDRVEVVPGLGSGGGILAVSEGVLQLSISGRDLKAEEKAKGLASAPFLDTPFVFVTSHPQPQKLTKAEVVAIYDGGLAKWPDDKPIKPILRPKSDSVTPFLIANFEGMQQAMDKLRQRPDVPVAATDSDNVEAAEKTANSFAGATLVQILTEKPRLRTIMLDGMEASVEAMEKGSYGLKMRLYAVMKSEPTPIAQRFAKFLHSAQAQQLIRESGGVLLSAPAAPVR
jgi:phosphate transport system substrate-binding protein